MGRRKVRVFRCCLLAALRALDEVTASIVAVAGRGAARRRRRGGGRRAEDAEEEEGWGADGISLSLFLIYLCLKRFSLCSRWPGGGGGGGREGE